jgi:hypothetical protein
VTIKEGIEAMEKLDFAEMISTAPQTFPKRNNPECKNPESQKW